MSTIDKLPPEAASALQNAEAALLERRLTQAEIWTAFNTELGVLGLRPITSSAFNRHATALMYEQKRLETHFGLASSAGGTDGVRLYSQLEGLKAAMLHTLEVVEAVQRIQREALGAPIAREA